MCAAESIECTPSSDAEKLSKNTTREDWKRYRKEFQQPVKFRCDHRISIPAYAIEQQ
jgi:hypothetical protein